MNKITSRKKTRKLLFQKLFSLWYNKGEDSLFNDSFVESKLKDSLDENYLKEMEEIVLSKENQLIEILKMYAPKFSPKNMDLTYVIPIFIWASEMFYLKEEIPAKVSINEAIEISKIYWSDSAKKIVNGVLNKVYENYDEIKEKLKSFDGKSDFSFFVE